MRVKAKNTDVEVTLTAKRSELKDVAELLDEGVGAIRQNGGLVSDEKARAANVLIEAFTDIVNDRRPLADVQRGFQV